MLLVALVIATAFVTGIAKSLVSEGAMSVPIMVLAVAFMGGLIGTVVVSKPKMKARKSSKASDEDLPVQATYEKGSKEDEEWKILSKYDTEVSKAVDVIRVHGEAAIEELWKAHQVINDKSQLSRIASQIDEEYSAAIAEQEALQAKRKIEDTPERKMEKLSIHKAGGKFIYKGYKYDRLIDAVAYAEKAEKDEKADAPSIGFGLLVIVISTATFVILIAVIGSFTS